ncbi:MAG: PAS domain-containing protein, partial [Ferruginibacter sp.]
HASGLPMFDDAGKPVSMAGMTSDITSSKTNEHRLYDAFRKIEMNERKLNIVIEGSELGTWEIDMRTSMLTASDRFMQITGLGHTEKMTLETMKMAINPEDIEIWETAFAKAFETGTLHCNCRINWPDQSVHWIESKGKVFFDEQNIPLNIIGTIRDITEEKMQKDILAKSEEKFRLLADSMPQHIWTADTSGILNYFNRSVFDYTGLSREQINDQGWLQIVHPDDRDENIRQWTEAVSNGTPFLFEHRFLRHDGNYRWQLSRAIPQKDNFGTIQMWVGISADIQERKIFSDEMEKQVTLRTLELEEKNIALEKMNKELESFNYISSHDLQEPLRKIQAFSSGILKTEYERLSERGKDYFDRMQNAAKRMQSLINDLLSYSLTGTDERIFKTTDLNKIVLEVSDDLKEEIALKNATVETYGLGELNIIPFQMRQLFLNLFTNSLKFAREGVLSKIRITAAVEKAGSMNGKGFDSTKDYCHISFTDNGIGFENIHNERIFELFKRLHGPADYQGTGVGLSIVKRIVENHNGLITAKSIPGEGARFDIYLPVSV